MPGAIVGFAIERIRTDPRVVPTNIRRRAMRPARDQAGADRPPARSRGCTGDRSAPGNATGPPAAGDHPRTAGVSRSGSRADRAGFPERSDQRCQIYSRWRSPRRRAREGGGVGHVSRARLGNCGARWPRGHTSCGRVSAAGGVARSDHADPPRTRGCPGAALPRLGSRAGAIPARTRAAVVQRNSEPHHTRCRCPCGPIAPKQTSAARDGRTVRVRHGRVHATPTWERSPSSVQTPGSSCPRGSS